jgi:uncharacterized membrane protein YhaH (DUF805 family)
MSEDGEEEISQSSEKRGFMDGRLNRPAFFKCWLMYLAGLFIGLLFAFSIDSPGFLNIVVVALSIYGLRISVLRLHDLDKSGFFVLPLIFIAFIPNIGIVAPISIFIGFFFLLFTPGTAGPNQFGPQPPVNKKN